MDEKTLLLAAAQLAAALVQQAQAVAWDYESGDFQLIFQANGRSEGDVGARVMYPEEVLRSVLASVSSALEEPPF